MLFSVSNANVHSAVQLRTGDLLQEHSLIASNSGLSMSDRFLINRWVLEAPGLLPHCLDPD